MKRRNQFDRLSSEDQQFIHQLCDQYTYAKACEILEQPRPDGLSLETTASTLCRWHTRSHPDAVQTGVTGQYCRAISTRHQAEGYANTQAVLALAENRLIDALRSGRALGDLTKESRFFFQAHKAWLEENKWRATRTDEDLKQSWDDYIEKVVGVRNVEFFRNDIDDPVAAELTPKQCDASTYDDYDDSIERAHGYPDHPKKPKTQAAQLLAALAALSRQQSKEVITQADFTTGPQPGQNQQSATPDSAILQNVASKKPEIAQIAPNCSFPAFAQNHPPSPADHHETRLKE